MDTKTLERFRKNQKIDTVPGIRMNKPLAARRLAGDIGLELEIEGTRLPTQEDIIARLHTHGHAAKKSGAYWTTHADGSLRGESQEYVFSSPCFEEELEPLLENLWALFKSKKTVLQNSNRCSTHCHINVQGLKVSDIVSVFSIWAVIEKQIIEKFGGETRMTNHFCLSLRDSEENVERLRTFLKTGKGPDKNLRYSAFNIASIFNRGSIEFRCGPPSNDMSIPLMFGIFLKKFVEYCVKNYHNPATIGQDLSQRGASDIFKAVCDTSPVLQEFYRIIIPQGGEYDFNRDGIEGFRIAQPLCYSFPWNDWMPLIDKLDVDPFDAENRPQDDDLQMLRPRLVNAPQARDPAPRAVVHPHWADAPVPPPAHRAQRPQPMRVPPHIRDAIEQQEAAVRFQAQVQAAERAMNAVNPGIIAPRIHGGDAQDFEMNRVDLGVDPRGIDVEADDAEFARNILRELGDIE